MVTPLEPEKDAFNAERKPREAFEDIWGKLEGAAARWAGIQSRDGVQRWEQSPAGQLLELSGDEEAATTHINLRITRPTQKFTEALDKYAELPQAVRSVYLSMREPSVAAELQQPDVHLVVYTATDWHEGSLAYDDLEALLEAGGVFEKPTDTRSRGRKLLAATAEFFTRKASKNLDWK